MEKKPLIQLNNRERVFLILNCSIALLLTLAIKSLPAQIFNPNSQQALSHPVLIFCALQALVFSFNTLELTLQHFLSSVVAASVISIYSPPSLAILVSCILSFSYIFLVHKGCLFFFKSTTLMTIILSVDFLFFLYLQLLGKEDAFIPLSLYGFLLQPEKIMNPATYLFLLLPATFVLLQLYKNSLANNNNRSR